MVPELPAPLASVTTKKFLSPSRFGDLLDCRLSVLAPSSASALPSRPSAILGIVLHHVAREVADGRWGSAATVDEAFAAILTATTTSIEAELSGRGEESIVPLMATVGRQVWLERASRARRWAREDAPSHGTGESPRPCGLDQRTDGSTKADKALVESGYEAWVVWPERRLRGRADLVLRIPPRRWRVVDNKSGAVRDRDDNLLPGIELQVGLYGLAIEAITGESVELIVRSSECVRIRWDALVRQRVSELLDRELGALPEGRELPASDLARPGTHCWYCRVRPRCTTYLTQAPALWRDASLAGRMPLDTWGEVTKVSQQEQGLRLEIRDDADRFVVVGRLDSRWGLDRAKIGDRLYFFDLVAAEDRQHAERVQPANFRDTPVATGSNRRRAHLLRVFRK